MILCHLCGPFSVVFPKKQIIIYSHVTYFIRCYWSHNIKVVEIGQAACSAKITPNPASEMAVFRILCKLGSSHALACFSWQRYKSVEHRTQVCRNVTCFELYPSFSARCNSQRQETTDSCSRSLKSRFP